MSHDRYARLADLVLAGVERVGFAGRRTAAGCMLDHVRPSGIARRLADLAARVGTARRRALEPRYPRLYRARAASHAP